MELFAADGHEQVVLCQDPGAGLRAIIAVHSTALGPALGGTRFMAYPDAPAALADVLRLSRAMSYKNALAGLAAGGGKAVILGDPAAVKTPDLLRAYGTAVARLGGRYVTACDVGTYVRDMDIVAETNPWTTGRSRELGGAGDSGELTALGVYAAMRAAAQQVWGTPELGGRTVAVAGLGKVGRRLAGHLLAAGAAVVAADPSGEAVAEARSGHPALRIVAPAELATTRADVFSPNALGGALTAGVVAGLTARVVCGGANNQLAGPDVAQALLSRGIVYCPDFVANAGGVIAVADEGLTGPYDHERATARVLGIGATMTAVLAASDDAGVSPAVAADRMAEDRIGAAAPSPWRATPAAPGAR